MKDMFVIKCGRGEAPPKWYGLGYRDYERDIAAFYPVPIHLLVRGAINLWLLIRWAGGEDRISKAYKDGFNAGYKKGRGEK